MMPFGYTLAWAASLVTFTFGALAFSTLAWSYWRQRRDQLQAVQAGGGIFPAFTMACAAAFLLNLVQQAVPRLVWVTPMLDVVTGILPALLLHLAWEKASRIFYGASLAVALGVAAADAGLMRASWSDKLEPAPAIVLGFGAAWAMAVQRMSDRRYGWWMRALLGLMAASAAASIWLPSPIFGLVPDYLLLAIFAVTLYYKERLIFFDVLLKRGVFFAAGLAAFAVFFAYIGRPSIVEQALFAVLWLAAPWVYTRIAGAVDHRWLRRRFSPAEAERRFAEAVQGAESEADLGARASKALEEICEARAEVRFDDTAAASKGGIEAEIGGFGRVTLGPRASGVPYLSDDRHLLQSLARTLGVVLENVRFRERERQLRSMADRAELKALRAQINPHFLFNALNAIAGLIHASPQAAEETVEHLAEVFRYTLRKAGTEWVRLDEEMEFVHAYLRVEQARFGERLAVEIAVDADAGSVAIPAMSVQPIVENAIKHGTANVEGVGRVSVRVRLEEQVLLVEVSDNGPGFPPGAWPPGALPPATGLSTGHGLRNVADRLSGYYGSSAGIECSNGEVGAVVRLRIPRKRAGT
jgi:signal transduction histidine kinase